MKGRHRILACFMAIILMVTAQGFPSNAVEVDLGNGNNFIPTQPTVASATSTLRITGVQVENQCVQIQAIRLNTSVTLCLELLVDGGVRLYDPNNCNDIFKENIAKLKDTIAVTEEGKKVTVTGTTSGARVVLDYASYTWTMEVYKKDSEIASYSIDGRKLLVKYSGNERKNVSLCGDIASGEQFIGLGERYTGTILNGKSYPLWNEDCWSAGLKGTKTTSYANVPLLHSSEGYSVFFNSFYSATADIGSEKNSGSYRFDFDGPDLDIFLWTGTPLENVKSYMSVTGTTATIPKWAVGYWAGGNSNNYWYNLAKKYYDADTEKAETATIADYYDEAMREVLQNYADMGAMPSAIFGESTPTRKIGPVSKASAEYGVELLGWYHPDSPWDADEYRLINQNVLKTLKGFTSTDEMPFIKTTSGDYYTYSNDGGKSEWNRVDYTHSNAERLLIKNLTRGWEKDLSGLMVDYGEYINADWVFANGMTGKEMHNLQAYYYNKAMKNVWDASSKKGDYILFSRAGAAGSQSYAAQFAGDQKCNFEGLKQAVMGGLSASASGFGIWGSDIGGLGIGPTASDKNPLLTAELYMRWLQYGTFSTLMRAHGTMDHDPWTFEDEVVAEGLDVNVEEVFQKYYWTRENLSDAIYSATLQSNQDGTPVMQVMGLSYPEYFGVGDQYLFCNEMLVAPVYEAASSGNGGTVEKSITFPEGKWYDLWTGQLVKGNGTAVAVEVPVDEIPVYVKSGSVMPVDLSATSYNMADAMEEGQRVKALLVTPAEEGESRTSTWYIGEDEKAPAFTYTSSMEDGKNTILAEQTSNNPKVIRGYGGEIASVLVDGERITKLNHEPLESETGFYINDETGAFVLVLPDGNWEEIILSDELEAEFHGINFENIDLSILDEMGFSSTQFNKGSYATPVETNQPVAKHWFSGNGKNTPYETRKGESGVNIWYSDKPTGLKTTAANKDRKVTFLNTPYEYENFEVSMEIRYGYSVGLILGPENVYPSSASSAAIQIVLANGRVQTSGALDNKTAVSSDGKSWSLYGTTGLFLAQSSFKGNTTQTLHVRMENRMLTIWIEGCEPVLTIKTAAHYEPGNIAFMANKFDEDGGGIESFSIREIVTRYRLYEPDEFASYREGDELKAPKETGFVFAGWFYDEQGKEAVQSDVRSTKVPVYAKFVPKSILSVQAQVSENLLDEDTSNDKSGDIRFVTTVDSPEYQRVGFDISYDAGKGTSYINSVSNKVYKTLYGIENDGEVTSYKPTEFDPASVYFKTVTIKGIKKAFYDMTFKVTPYWRTLDGTKVCGETVEKTIRQGLE